MCGFLVTNKPVSDAELDHANFYIKFRGPDHTEKPKIENISFIHNLLSLTGEFRPQPIFKDNIAVVYNGEIYNFKELDKDAKSDGDVIIPLYKEYGANFLDKLDGEFSIVLIDFNTNKAILAVDTFETKPLYVAHKGPYFGAASLRSGLVRLGFKHIRELRCNTGIIYNIKSLAVEDIFEIHKFDVENEHKKTFDDWHNAFEAAVLKRLKYVDLKKTGVGLHLSEGHDSGSIAACLKKYNLSDDILIHSFITQDMHPEVLRWRHGLDQDTLPKNGSGEIFKSPNFKRSILDSIREEDFVLSNILYKKRVEDFDYFTMTPEAKLEVRNSYYHFTRNMYHLIYRARLKHSCRIGLGGYGGDGVSSAWVNKIYKKYGSIWPIINFRDNSMYLSDIIAGSLGVEVRNPYMDKALWQESFWMDKSVYRNENNNHKPPLHDYLEKEKFPFYKRDKNNDIEFFWIGFGNFLNFNSVHKDPIYVPQPDITL